MRKAIAIALSILALLASCEQAALQEARAMPPQAARQALFEEALLAKPFEGAWVSVRDAAPLFVLRGAVSGEGMEEGVAGESSSMLATATRTFKTLSPRVAHASRPRGEEAYFKLNARATLAGRIRLADGLASGAYGLKTEHLRSLTVVARNISLSTDERSVQTDPEGRFRFEGLLPGATYRLGLNLPMRLPDLEMGPVYGDIGIGDFCAGEEPFIVKTSLSLGSPYVFADGSATTVTLGVANLGPERSAAGAIRLEPGNGLSIEGPLSLSLPSLAPGERKSFELSLKAAPIKEARAERRIMVRYTPSGGRERIDLVGFTVHREAMELTFSAGSAARALVIDPEGKPSLAGAGTIRLPYAAKGYLVGISGYGSPAPLTYSLAVNAGSGARSEPIEARGGATELDATVAVAGQELQGAVPPKGLAFFALSAEKVPLLVRPLDGETVYEPRPLLDWGEVGGVSGFEYELASGTGIDRPIERGRVSGAITEQALGVTLADGANYTWRVRALDLDGLPGPWTESRSFAYAVDRPKPLEPANGAIIDDSAPALRWTEARNAAYYLVELDDDPSFDSPIAAPKALQDTQYKLSGQGLELLRQGAAYRFRVAAVNDAGVRGAWSDASLFRLDLGYPRLESPADGAIMGTGELGFRWEKRERAASYAFIVAEEKSLDAPISLLGAASGRGRGYAQDGRASLGLSANAYAPAEAELGPFSRGRTYYWSVAIVDEHGVLGPFAPARSFALAPEAMAYPNPLLVSGLPEAKREGASEAAKAPPEAQAVGGAAEPQAGGAAKADLANAGQARAVGAQAIAEGLPRTIPAEDSKGDGQAPGETFDLEAYLSGILQERGIAPEARLEPRGLALGGLEERIGSGSTAREQDHGVTAKSGPAGEAVGEEAPDSAVNAEEPGPADNRSPSLSGPAKGDALASILFGALCGLGLAMAAFLAYARGKGYGGLPPEAFGKGLRLVLPSPGSRIKGDYLERRSEIA